MTNGSEKYIEAVRFCGKLYDFINEKFFNGELVKPVITVQSCERNKFMGWFVPKKVWKETAEDGGENEINISANFLNRPLIEIAETMLHEMCHHYANVNNIQDCSRSGAYHNKLFRKIADEHGLTAENVSKIGWSKTALTTESHSLISAYLINEQSIIFRLPLVKGSRIKSCSTRKYVCPKCGTSVRATRQVNIICADCNEIMQEDEE